MKLDWAILADAGQVREGLAFVIGAGIDTVNAVQTPAALNGTLLVRLLLHKTETGRPHKIELRFADEDGNELGKVNADFTVPDNPDVPVGWDHSAMFALNIHGMPLQKWGRYSIDILADGNHLRTLNLRLKQVTLPEQPGQLPKL